ncbi:MAG: response regulator transcription factor [Anaerolineaceae bacterium]|nr:response regulator transcription factor [Anaerolineaceae bacterium]
MSNILVIEDEPSVGEVVGLYLRRAGYPFTIIRDGREALTSLEKQLPALVILDLMLPGQDGWEILRWLRERSDVPVIMLTARSAETDRIAGLEMGADDYIVKPFSPQELVSRVRAVFRRTRPASAENETSISLENSGTMREAGSELLSLGELSIDPQKRLVTVKGEERNLTAKEFDLLFHLARHPRQVFTRDQLLERVWGLAEYIDPGTVTVHIRRLREKIETDPAAPRRLLTVWGVGYKLEP